MSALAEDVEAQTDPLSRFRQAAAGDLRLFALLHDRELDRELVLTLWQDCYEDFLGLRLQSEKGRETLALFRHGLTDIPTELNRQTLDILAAEYADIYLNHTLGASPCESVWLDDENLAMQEPMFQVREWYRRHGLAVVDWRKRTDDHLVNQLRFLAHMLEEHPGSDNLSQIARFLDEHLLRWIGDFAGRVSARAQTRFYSALAQLTAAYAMELRDLLAELTGESIPSREEIEERMRPKVSIAVDAPRPYVPGTSPSW